MKKILFTLLFFFTLNLLLIGSDQTESKDNLTIDFEMVEKGIQWLEFINSGADDASIKKYFMTHVAPTKGCQSIINHWARFMEWNNELLYKFIMTALGRIPTDKKIKNEDGTLTMLGRRQMLWMKALKNTDILKQDLEALKKIDFNKQSVRLAKKFLPSEAVLEANFYFVLFGHSTAFSVGKENGYDFLQLPKTKEGIIDVQQLTNTFAHEMHHTGFSYLQEKHMKDIKKQENMLLAGILTAEGMPTYFIDQPWKQQEVAADWAKHSKRKNELYKEAEKDIRLNLEGKIGQKEIMEQWMGGIKGAAYVLGADMLSVIDTYLGRDEVLNLASDYRQLLLVYNQAAKKAKEKGNEIFIFNEELAKNLSQYK